MGDVTMEVANVPSPATPAGTATPANTANRADTAALSGTAAPALRIDGLMRRYGERAALDDVTCRCPAGRRSWCSAPTAPARRTLLRVLATLLRPHEARSSVLGAPLPARRGRCAARSGCWRTSRCSTASCAPART